MAKNKSILNGFYNVTERIREALQAEPFVNTVTFGDLFDVDLNKQTIFPLAHLIVANATLTENVWVMNFDLLLMDLVDETKVYKHEAINAETNFQGNNNEQDILNTQLAVANRIFELLRRGSLYDDLYQLDGSPSCTPFMDRFENKLTGWTCNFSVIVSNNMTICE